MASYGVDLGCLGLASTASGLELQLTSHAKIALPETGQEFVQEELTNAGDCLSGRTWYRRGKDFHMVISLAFEGDFEGCSMASVTETVAQRLGVAEHWHQIPIRPVSIHSSMNGDMEGRIIVHLDHGGAILKSQRQQHKLEDGVPYHDRNPPPGVRIFDLNEVRLRMRFTQASRRKRRKVGPGLSECADSLEDEDQLLDELLDADTAEDDFMHPPSSNPTPHASRRGANRSFRRSKTSPCRDSRLSDDDELLFDVNEAKDKAEDRQCSTITSKKRSYSTGDLCSPAATSSNDMGGILNLFDAGFRLAIASSSRRLGRGVRIVSNESFRHLADSFPSLWCPGYLKAMSTRAVFLPTISHALSTVCDKHARTQALRSKLAELHRQNTSPCSLGEPSLQKQSSVAARLWQAMQSKLFHAQAARRPTLSSRSLANMIEENADAWPDRLLDDKIDDGASNNDDSMLDEEPLTPESDPNDPDLLWNDIHASEDQGHLHAKWHMAEQKRGLHVDDVPDDEILSLCGSVGSIVLKEEVGVAGQGPDVSSVPSEGLVAEDLLGSSSEDEGTMEELLPI